MAVLAILQPDARIEARLSEALAGAHDVTLRADWADLDKVLRSTRFDACLVDADHPDREWASRRIAELRSHFPDMAIVACVESDNPQGYFDLGTLGVDGVVVSAGRATAVRADVDRALANARAQLVERALQDDFPAPGPEALSWAVRHAGAETSVERLSASLGMTPTALRDALNSVGLPSPTRILVWGRLLQAGARLAENGRRVEDVAFSLGYSTAAAFARAMKLHTGLTPAEVARADGLWTVLEALIERAPREASPRRGGPTTHWAMARVGSLLGALLISACASFGVDGDAVNRVVGTPPIDQIHMGILAVDAETGRELYSRNAHRKFVPASNQKILVTATALSLLGPDWRFRTEVRAAGVRTGATLSGDLEVVPSGDPSFSDRYWESGTQALAALADSLRATGITRVTGVGVVDVSAWDSTTIGPTWEFEDLRYAYGATGGAFAIDEGEIRAIVTAGPEVGAPAAVVWSPSGTPDFVESRLVTVEADSTTRVRPSYRPETRRLVLDGTVALGTADTTSFASRDPVRQAVAALADAVSRAGIVVEGGWSIRWTRPPDLEATSVAEVEAGLGGSTPSGPTTLAAMESPPLSELIAGILKPSQNWMTEQTVRALGARFGAEGSWREGVGVVEAYLVNEVGVDSLDIAARDGSGLSAYNLVTPRAIVRILREMRTGPYATEFREALAQPGEEDSTLEERLPDLAGRVFAKTGTISNVNSLSGYLVRDDGREVIFSILTNGSGLPSSRVRAAIDDVVRGLAR